jgi:uncharacterized membrane protein
LLTRGLWLIFLELVVVRCLGWQFNFDYHLTVLVVLWALGWSMIVLSGLVYLPAWAVTAFGVVLIAGHNLLDGIHSHDPIWTILHSPYFIWYTPPYSVFVAYTLIPWVGVTAAGYGLGQIYRWTTGRRRKFLAYGGLGATAGFILLRLANVYGDPSRWAHQPSAGFTVLSFLNTTKYPPSLLYLLMTLGPALLFLWAIDVRTPGFLRPALVFGQVPMFYYLLHIPLIHVLAVGACYLRYGQVHWMFESPTIREFPISQPPGWEFSLSVVYAVWAAVVIALYPICTWFAGVKRRRREVWLSYF